MYLKVVCSQVSKEFPWQLPQQSDAKHPSNKMQIAKSWGSKGDIAPAVALALLLLFLNSKTSKLVTCGQFGFRFLLPPPLPMKIHVRNLTKILRHGWGWKTLYTRNCHLFWDCMVMIGTFAHVETLWHSFHCFTVCLGTNWVTLHNNRRRFWSWPVSELNDRSS